MTVLNYICFPAALSDYLGSTENLCGGGLQRAPSLPRSYRQRSGIPVLNRDSM